MRQNLSYNWLNYNWRTKATTDDLHHHRSMQVKRDDHTFSSNNCMETKVHSAKTKNLSIISYTYTITTFKDKWTKQSGFNAEQIEKDKYPESKNRLEIKSKITR